MSWERIDLTSDEYAETPRPPDLCDLVYLHGPRHVFSGPFESAKTTLAFIVGLNLIRTSGAYVAHVDFEMGAIQTRLLLEELGASLKEIGRFAHFEPDGPPEDDDIVWIAENCYLAIIDAAAGAYDVSGLDDNKRADAEKFARAWIRPLWQDGISTILLDHVVKNTDNRGRFAIGSERKIGQADVHLGLETVTPLRRGGTGLYRIVTHKDRFGHLPRPRAAELRLDSDPVTHAITWTFQAPAETSNGWKPTVLMAKVSAFLAEQSGPVSRNVVDQNVTGQATYVRAALDELIAAGYATEKPGARRAKLVELVHPFTSSDLVATSSDELASHFVSSSDPLKGDEDEDEVEDEHPPLRYYESIYEDPDDLLERHADIAEGRA